MDTIRLKYFCAIVETGSLTKAAEMIGMSHSGLSKAMSILQDELGFKVFRPKGRGLELTDSGKELYEQSRKILELVGAIKNQTSVATQILRIGLPEVLALASAEQLAKQFSEGVTIEDLDSGKIEARTLDRRIDFGFTFVPFPHRDLDHLKMATVSLSSFCRTGHFQKQIAEKIPYVIPSQEMKDNPLSIKVRDGWNSQLSRSTPFRANSLSIALRMVQSGMCAIYTPDFFVSYFNESAPQDRRLVKLDMAASRAAQEQTRRDVFLVKRSGVEESKSMKSIAKIIRQVCLWKS